MRSSRGGARSNIHRPKIELFPPSAKHVKRNLITNALSLFAAMALMCAVITALSADNKSNATQTDPLSRGTTGWRNKPPWTFVRTITGVIALSVAHAKSGIPVTLLVAVPLGIT